MTLLVQFRFDKGMSTLTVDDWMNAIPQWASDAYSFVGILLTALLIWAITCLIQRGIEFGYVHWQIKQKEKYPLEY